MSSVINRVCFTRFLQNRYRLGTYLLIYQTISTVTCFLSLFCFSDKCLLSLRQFWGLPEDGKVIKTSPVCSFVFSWQQAPKTVRNHGFITLSLPVWHNKQGIVWNCKGLGEQSLTVRLLSPLQFDS